MKAKHLGRYVSLSALSMLLLVSVSAIPIPVKGQSYGGTLVVHQPTEPKLLTTNYISDGVGVFNVDIVYNRLVAHNYKWEIIPDLAESWEISADGKTYTFHLVNNATWHDGEKVTSADVKWSYESIIQNKGTTISRLKEVETIETPDDYTVVIKLKELSVGFLSSLAHYAGPVILPKHIWEGLDPYDNQYLTEPSVGSGPFKFEGWVPGSHITYVANEDYFQGRPYLDKIVCKIIESLPTAVVALEKGEVHFSRSAPLREAVRLRQEEIITITPWTDVSLIHLQFNLRQSEAPWINVKVRKAIAYAVDRDDIAFRTYAGMRKALDNIYYEGHWATNPDAKMPEYDPEEAERLLDEAGYPRGPDGTRFTMRLTTYTVDESPIVGQILKYHLHQVGIELHVETVIFGTWWDKVVKRHDFDLALGGGAHGPDPDELTKQLSPTGYRNSGGWNNSRVDELLDLGRSTVDIEKRKEYYYEIQEILVEELPRIYLFGYDWLFSLRKEFTGVSNDPALLKYNLKTFGFRMVHLVEAEEEEEPPPLPIELVAGAAVAAIVVIAGAAYWLGRRSRPK